MLSDTKLALLGSISFVSYLINFDSVSSLHTGGLLQGFKLQPGIEPPTVSHGYHDKTSVA